MTEKNNELIDAANQFIKDLDLKYIREQESYYVKTDEGYLLLRPTAMKASYSEWEIKDFPRVVSQVLETNKLKFNRMTYSFKKVPSDTFNLLDKSNWLQPSSGEHHWIFDLLMMSLGGGKQENIDHIEQLITYKYLHPGDFLLPCLIVHGEGGIGKDLLVSVIFPHIFGKHASIQTDVKLVTGTHNDIVEGKTVVLINEAKSDKTDTDSIKGFLSTPYFPINKKFKAPFMADNTAFYIIGSNKTDGGIWLDRSDADRRFSVCCVEKGKNLVYWIAEHQNISLKEARDWMKSEGQYICGLEKEDKQGNLQAGNTQEISKWLGSLIAKWGKIRAPFALHGADYEKLLKIQTPMDELLIKAVFQDEHFTHIQKETFYKCYELLCHQYGSAKKGSGKFFKAVEDYVAADPNITEGNWREGEGYFRGCS